MPGKNTYCDAIQLYVEGRISPDDAKRQEVTAREILSRLETRAGVILADEVGMGKTFVALAVAVSAALSDPERRPVIVMVPPSLQQKWPRDFMFFKERCLPKSLRSAVTCDTATRPGQFLKFLDDPEERRKSILFVTHGAMSRGLKDKWIKLALIQQSLHYRRDVDHLKRDLCKIMGSLLRSSWMDNRSKLGPDFWMKMLNTDPAMWLKIIQRHAAEFDCRNDGSAMDDPVPRSVLEILGRLNTDPLFEALDEIPRRKRGVFKSRLKNARQAIQDALKPVWAECVRKMRMRLPLLILDEAHHLKNADTKLASLFRCVEARDDMVEIDRGALHGIFERMLFLTATPFQLGHGELCSVLGSFRGIAWEGEQAPAGGVLKLDQDLTDLRKSLDAAQEAAVRFDTAWGLLQTEHLRSGDRDFTDTAAWWRSVRSMENRTPEVDRVIRCHEAASERLHRAEALLKPWVIRHLRDRLLPAPHHSVSRRNRLPGRAILDDQPVSSGEGIGISGGDLIPFLLAVRATTFLQDQRSLFAEGLASSYEAFLNTRKIAESKEDESVLDGDEDSAGASSIPDHLEWYLDQMDDFVKSGRAAGARSHPKIDATVKRAIEIWRNGEKVIVFCHFVATGRTLRKAISSALAREIETAGALKMGCSFSETASILDNLGDRFYDEDSPIRKACDESIYGILEAFPSLERWRGELNDVTRRMIRTPSFLVRFFSLAHSQLDENDLREAFDRPDSSGTTIRRMLHDFFEFLATRCDKYSREEIIKAVHRIQTGSHFSGSRENPYSDDELQGDEREMLVPNVRLVNGTTRQDTRQRLMLAFNTPFYPEILIASSVMAEGVDLHLNCRHIIHHDLCWNPSTLEQRTGRVDRVGAKTERVGKSIQVYLPYLSQTQDEKMYRVVMDRERWFNIVMGEKYSTDVKNTEKLAARVELPGSIAEELSFKLEVHKPSTVDTPKGMGPLEK